MISKGINVFGFLDGEFGIAEATRLNCKSIIAADIPITMINYGSKTVHRHQDKTFTEFSETANYDVNLVQISSHDSQLIDFFNRFDFNNFENKYNILYFAWESETLPNDYQNFVYNFDEIWTPSQYCKNCLQKYFNLPITVIPHPIELDLPKNIPNEIENFFNKSNFNFLFIFDYNSSIVRKNVIELINIFKKAFDDWENNAFLTIKTSKSKKFSKEKNEIDKAVGNCKKIAIVEEIYDKIVLNKIIYDCDVYISLHLSEGFGLTMAEAMYFGKIVIASNYSGNLEFMNDENSILIDSESGIKFEEETINYSNEIVWSKLSTEDVIKKLKYVYENKSNFNELKKKASHDINKNLSFESIGKKIKERLDFIYNNNLMVKPRSSFNIKLSKDANELRIYRKSLIIRFIYLIKMYFRNRKK